MARLRIPNVTKDILAALEGVAEAIGLPEDANLPLQDLPDKVANALVQQFEIGLEERRDMLY